MMKKVSLEGKTRVFWRLFLLCLFLLMLSLVDFISFKGVFPENLWRRIEINKAEIQNDAGYAYWVRTGSARFHSGNKQSVGIVLEDESALGLGNEPHENIRKLGKGRYSFWLDGVYFSSSDNSSPLENGRQYEVRVPYALPIQWAYLLYGLTVLSLLLLFVLMMSSSTSERWTRGKIQNWVMGLGKSAFIRYLILPVKWIWVNMIPGIVVAVVVLLVMLGGGEVYFRIKLPFNKAYWPSQFDERYGFNFIPRATVEWTNYQDYWTRTEANSLGFLDREPPASGDSPDTCRVVFIGDSFVEAAQVTIRDKIQMQFEEIANQASDSEQGFETVALGYSGSGQVNQLSFYDVFARSLEPDVVVLVFVNNDFGNNSTTLESIRNGWHPLHPPSLFFEYDEQADGFTKIPIDPNWQNYLLPTPARVTPNMAESALWLSNHTYLYNQMNSRFFANSPKLSMFLSGTPPIAEIYKARLEEIKKIDGYSDDFGDWDPTVTDIDNMFVKEQLPPAFEEAVVITGYALDQFKERGERDGFDLILLTTSGVSTIDGGKQAMFNRIYKLANERGIPVVDQYEYLVSNGFRYNDVSFPHDAHWNQLGHQTAADALWEYFEANPSICE